jgi:hypothetical protein
LSHLFRVVRRLLLLAVPLALALTPASALAAGELAIDPAEADFGEVPAGLSGGWYLTVTNAGPDPVQLGEIDFEGDADPFSIEAGGCLEVLELAGGESCSLNVTFRAPMDTADYEALLIVEGDGVTPAVASLTASSLFEGYLVSDVAEIWVGPTPIGTLSAPHPVRIRNVGDTPVSIKSAGIYGPPSIIPFKVAANGCVGVLEPDAECVVEVVFSPNSFWGPGHQGAALMVIYPGQIGVLVPLNGEAVAALAPPQHAPPPAPLETPPTRSSQRRALTRLSASIPGLIRGGPSTWRTLPPFNSSMPGRLTLALFAWEGGTRVRIGGGNLGIPASAAKQMRFRLNKRGRTLLRRPRATRVSAVVTFQPTGGKLVRQSAQFVVKKPLAKRKKR